ncbi:DUF1214 domain-containing protein [Spongiibacter sp. KMU-166]|uniref:DUF1214 domain-containing protein n=1 Tax=Spongiibacter thalassae TaxID=2721624 RepID=A0ABX1GAS1_9GAMM|nr:DUF1214 domain-containing protein [Spongiibacter thalassae]NKI16046.1 DUF1214 domain-containing protein [Spongiibacter thalassae]
MSVNKNKTEYGVGASGSNFSIPEDETNKVRKALMDAPPASLTARPDQASPALRSAWQSYHSAVDEMRFLLEKSSMFKNPRYRAKAFHVMMEIQAIAYSMTIAPRTATPRIHTNSGWHDDIFSLGLVGADWHYGLLYLDGAYAYKLSGRKGENELLLLQVCSDSLGMPDHRTIGMHDFNDIVDFDENGNYEVIIGGPPRERNWVALDNNSNWNLLYIRTQIKKFGNEDIGEYRIEHLAPVEADLYEQEEFDEAVMAERIHRAEMLMRIYIKEFTIGIWDFANAGSQGKPNVMSPQPGLTFVGGSSFSVYAQGAFSIDEDEALIIELKEAPTSPYWGIMLGDTWSRALPFSRYQTSLNNAQAVQDSDGGYRFVLSIKDPGVANWLDPTKHNHGEMFFRNYFTTETVVPDVMKVKLDKLLDYLPGDTALVSPEERKAAIRYRREGFVRMYGE